MSGSKRARAEERRDVAETVAGRGGPDRPAAAGGSRIRAAGRRAGMAKATLGAGGALLFGAAMLFARVSYAGHPKRPPSPLAAPPHFVNVVRENLLQAGIVEPMQAPPDAETSVS